MNKFTMVIYDAKGTLHSLNGVDERELKASASRIIHACDPGVVIEIKDCSRWGKQLQEVVVIESGDPLVVGHAYLENFPFEVEDETP